jgi:MOSC domain-containing protein YiiM
MQSGRVVALHLKPPEGGVSPVEELVAVDNVGFEGDKCAGKKTRQALLISTESLREFGYEAGQLKEQVTVELPNLQNLPKGAMVQAGNVVFRIEGDCAPCGGMARALGEEPETFQAKMANKRGMLASIAKGGRLKVGDEVCVLER